MIAKRKGVAVRQGLREARSERSVEQTYEPMNKNPIAGIRQRASGPMTAKPISIKGAGCEFGAPGGGPVRKAVELTSLMSDKRQHNRLSLAFAEE